MASISALPLTKLIEALHAHPLKFSLVTTGAGGSAIAALMAVAGCSKTLLNAHVPYHQAAVENLIGHLPAKSVSSTVSRQLAQFAYNEAKQLCETAVAGVGCTAALQTDRTRRGADAVWVSSWTSDAAVDYNLVMSKDLSRGEQEEGVKRLIIAAMLDVCGISHELRFDEFQFSKKVTQIPRNPVSCLLKGLTNCVIFNEHGQPRLDVAPFTTENAATEEKILLLYPGSFKPLHWGHTELGRVAGLVMQRFYSQSMPVVLTYEISLSIVGKKDVSEEDCWGRVRQFTDSGRRVAITTARLFVDKAKMFKNHGLIVGVDTARRVVDPVFYNDDPVQMIAALKEIESCGCYFVVGGRMTNGEWDDMASVNVPKEIAHLFKAIQPSDFRVDISSTEIRARGSSLASDPGSYESPQST